MILIAVLIPALSFLLRGKILQAILCVVLQITFLGWLPASLWAVVSLYNARAEKRTKRIERAIYTAGK